MEMNFKCNTCGADQRIRKYPETTIELECTDPDCAIIVSVSLPDADQTVDRAIARRLYEEQPK